MEDDDHRILGRRLDLFHFEEDASGMVYWHPAGWALYRQLEDFLRERMRQFAYKEVQSPQLLPRSLWEQSGHWEKFRENMIVVPRVHGRDLALKPMSCPCHLQIYNSSLRSWRDLPLRLCEFGACHRDEPSGSMHGLMRTRAFVQDDAHVICTTDQVADEVCRFVSLLSGIYEDLGFEEFGVALSLRPASRAGTDAEWDDAERLLRAAAELAGLRPIDQLGEGAFYGPKLEFSLRDRDGRSWQCGTIQLDFVLPSRLEAKYVDHDGSRKTPVMLHHAVFGSMGRFIGILLEHYRGKLPFWLAPIQVSVMAVAGEHAEDAHSFRRRLEESGIRTHYLEETDTLSRRILASHDLHIPVIAIIGSREKQDETVSLKYQDERVTLSKDDALSRFAKAVRERSSDFG